MASPAKKKAAERLSARVSRKSAAEQEAESGSNASEIADEPDELGAVGRLDHSSRVAIPQKKAPQVSARAEPSATVRRAVDLALSKESEEVRRTE